MEREVKSTWLHNSRVLQNASGSRQTDADWLWCVYPTGYGTLVGLDLVRWDDLQVEIYWLIAVQARRSDHFSFKDLIVLHANCMRASWPPALIGWKQTIRAATVFIEATGTIEECALEWFFVVIIIARQRYSISWNAAATSGWKMTKETELLKLIVGQLKAEIPQTDRKHASGLHKILMIYELKWSRLFCLKYWKSLSWTHCTCNWIT